MKHKTEAEYAALQEKIVHLYRDKKYSIKQIGYYLDMGTPKVTQLLRTAGIEIRPSSARMRWIMETEIKLAKEPDKQKKIAGNHLHYGALNPKLKNITRVR